MGILGLEKHIEKGETKFISFSGNPEVVETAQEKGIPCVNNDESFNINDYVWLCNIKRWKKLSISELKKGKLENRF